MITFAQPSHKALIAELWQQAFGDSEEYIQFYLAHRYNPNNTLLWVEEGRVDAMLTVLPCKLAGSGKQYRCGYVYGVATAASQRGRGLNTLLMEAMHSHLATQGYDLSILHPAQPSLFAFYEERGYRQCGSVRTLVLQAGEQAPDAPSFDFEEMKSSALVNRMRQAAIGEGCVLWDDQAMDYIMAENAFSGGKFLKFPAMLGGQGLACCVPLEDELLIKELICPVEQIEAVAQALCALWHKPKATVRLCHGIPMGIKTPFAMAKWYRKATGQKEIYLAHVLD